MGMKLLPCHDTWVTGATVRWKSHFNGSGVIVLYHSTIHSFVFKKKKNQIMYHD